MERLKNGKYLVHVIAIMLIFVCMTGRSLAAGNGAGELEYRNQKMKILDYNDSVQCPEGFEQKEIKISDRSVLALENETLDLTLVLAQGGDREQNLYIYDKGELTGLFQTLSFQGRTYVVLPLPEDQKQRLGYRTDTMEIQGVTAEVWVNEKKGLSDYCQLYLMNEEGESAIYQYEATEGTIQKVYETQESAQEQESVQSASDENEYDLLWDRLEIYYAIAVFGVLVVITLLIGPGKVNAELRSRKRAEYYAEKIEASYGDLEAVVDPETVRQEEENRNQSRMLDALQKNIYVPELVSAVYENSSITVSWKPSDTVQGYNIYRKTVNGKWKCIKQIRDHKISEYKDNCLVTNAMYTYTVRSYVLLGEEEVLSNYNRQGITEVALHGYQPPVPKMKKADVLSTGVRISWEADPEADSYMIYRKENGGKWDKINTIENTGSAEYIDTNANTGVLYEYTVRSRKTWGHKVYDSDYQNPGLKISLK